MVKGLYTASSGMIQMMRKHDQAANNLANINTTGFKKNEIYQRSLIEFVKTDEDKHFMNDEIVADEVRTHFIQGDLVESGSRLDVGIEGDGFLTVLTPDGLRYTRNGAMSLDSEGFLSTYQGYRILNEGNNPIQITGTGPVTINQDGELLQGIESLGLIQITQFTDNQTLEKTGENLFQTRPESIIADRAARSPFSLRQGFLERSNVNPVETMVNMLSGLRNYQSDQKAIAAIDETLNKAVNQVGRLQG